MGLRHAIGARLSPPALLYCRNFLRQGIALVTTPCALEYETVIPWGRHLELLELMTRANIYVRKNTSNYVGAKFNELPILVMNAHLTFNSIRTSYSSPVVVVTTPTMRYFWPAVPPATVTRASCRAG